MYAAKKLNFYFWQCLSSPKVIFKAFFLLSNAQNHARYWKCNLPIFTRGDPRILVMGALMIFLTRPLLTDHAQLRVHACRTPKNSKTVSRLILQHIVAVAMVKMWISEHLATVNRENFQDKRFFVPCNGYEKYGKFSELRYVHLIHNFACKCRKLSLWRKQIWTTWSCFFSFS